MILLVLESLLVKECLDKMELVPSFFILKKGK